MLLSHRLTCCPSIEGTCSLSVEVCIHPTVMTNCVCFGAAFGTLENGWIAEISPYHWGILDAHLFFFLFRLSGFLSIALRLNVCICLLHCLFMVYWSCPPDIWISSLLLILTFFPSLLNKAGKPFKESTHAHTELHQMEENTAPLANLYIGKNVIHVNIIW